jgi:hypothetical protein
MHCHRTSGEVLLWSEPRRRRPTINECVCVSWEMVPLEVEAPAIGNKTKQQSQKKTKKTSIILRCVAGVMLLIFLTPKDVSPPVLASETCHEWTRSE